jgi:hypothetical protein
MVKNAPAARWEPAMVKVMVMGFRRSRMDVTASGHRSRVRSAGGQIEVVNTIAVSLRRLPLPARWAVAGAATAGVIGAIAGLVIGLCVYAPTAAFAVVELGLPAAVAGGFLGLAVGVIVTAIR